MDWERMARFFTLEAVAAYIVALGSLALYVYEKWRSKRGRHVVCTQRQRQFSHLTLSKRAKQWLKVQYIGGKKRDRVQVDALSQVVIDIENASNTDALNDVNLEFRLPEAKVVRLWWEDAPGYLLERAKLDHSPEHKPLTGTKEPLHPPWKVRVFLPQLKSRRKYGEVVRIGILADGDLGTIEMPQQGSSEGVPGDQVWTAKFVSYDQVVRRRTLPHPVRRLGPFAVIAGMCGYLGWRVSEQLGYKLDNMAFSVGILVATLTGFIWFLFSDWWYIAIKAFRPKTEREV